MSSNRASAHDATVGQSDCDLTGITTLKVGSAGTGTATTMVSSGPIGTKKHDCTAAGTRCFLSVGQLTTSNNAQRADDINLTFDG